MWLLAVHAAVEEGISGRFRKCLRAEVAQPLPHHQQGLMHQPARAGPQCHAHVRHFRLPPMGILVEPLQQLPQARAAGRTDGHPIVTRHAILDELGDLVQIIRVNVWKFLVEPQLELRIDAQRRRLGGHSGVVELVHQIHPKPRRGILAAGIRHQLPQPHFPPVQQPLFHRREPARHQNGGGHGPDDDSAAHEPKL